MCHLSEWNTQQAMMKAAIEAGYDKYLYFEARPNHIVCELKKEYRATERSKRDIEEIDKFLFNIKYQTKMIIMPVKADAKHVERKPGKFIYRYGYQPIQGSTTHVQACVEECQFRLKEEAIKKKVEDYCSQQGIENEWNPADYGFDE